MICRIEIDIDELWDDIKNDQVSNEEIRHNMPPPKLYKLRRCAKSLLITKMTEARIHSNVRF